MTKLRILNPLYAYLIGRTSAKQRDALYAIFERHKQAVPQSLNGFWFKGKHYCENLTAPYNQVKPLHPSLHSEMKEWVKQDNQIDEDNIYIKTYLTVAIQYCKSEQLYQVFPSGLHPALDKLGIKKSSEPIDEFVLQLINDQEKGRNLVLLRLLGNLS